MNHPIIVLEGPDGAGKTTWAREYIRQFGGRYIHLTYRRPNRNMHAYQVASLWMALKASKHGPVIIDRHWPSEQIYAGVYRGGSVLQKEAKWMERLMSLLGVYYVICFPSTIEFAVEQQKRLANERSEMYKADANFKEIIHGYRDWWYGTSSCKHNIGHCSHEIAMDRRIYAAKLYQLDVHGKTAKSLAEHLDQVHNSAILWRRICMQDKFCQKLSTNRGLLAHECGYN